MKRNSLTRLAFLLTAPMLLGGLAAVPAEAGAGGWQSLLTLITSSQQGGGLNADTLFRTGPPLR